MYPVVVKPDLWRKTNDNYSFIVGLTALQIHYGT